MIEQSGTDLHLTANTKGVDAVVPAVARCPGPDRVCMIVFRSAVLQPVRESILADHQKIETLTPLHIEQVRDHSLVHPEWVREITQKIGRASCREREEIAGGDGAWE